MAKKNKVKKVAKIYQLEIWLNGIKPRIWRKFAVESDIRLDKLHLVIQDVMGWTDTHLHQFSTRDMQYGAADPDFDMDDSEDERKFKLCDLVNRPREQFGYEYDFGDCWEHVVKLVAIEDAQENVEYPICTPFSRFTSRTELVTSKQFKISIRRHFSCLSRHVGLLWRWKLL